MMIDRKRIEYVRDRVQEVLDDLGHEVELKFAVGRAKYGAHYISFQLEAAEIGEGGEILSAAALEFRQRCGAYGLQPSDLGRTFTAKGTEYKLVGLNSRRPKYPFLAERISDGMVLKFTAGWVRSLLGYAPTFRDL